MINTISFVMDKEVVFLVAAVPRVIMKGDKLCQILLVCSTNLERKFETNLKMRKAGGPKSKRSHRPKES